MKLNSTYDINDVVLISSYGSDEPATGIIDAILFQQDGPTVYPAYRCSVGFGSTDENGVNNNTIYAYEPRYADVGEGEAMYTILGKVGNIDNND